MIVLSRFFRFGEPVQNMQDDPLFTEFAWHLASVQQTVRIQSSLVCS